MTQRGSIAVVIPALNEERALPSVLAEIPRPPVGRVVVADNGSTDRTAELARAAGAEVVWEPRRGYGAACLAALRHLAQEPPEIVVFLDGDYSDHPGELPELIAPIEQGRADMVIGSRTRGRRERGALSVQQQVGNLIACRALGLLYGVHYTDLVPFRAIRWQALRDLQMEDPDWGWTVEMQIKAARCGLQSVEIPVSYRSRIGVSKISGNLRGAFRAGAKILWVLGRYAWC